MLLHLKYVIKEFPLKELRTKSFWRHVTEGGQEVSPTSEDKTTTSFTPLMHFIQTISSRYSETVMSDVTQVTCKHDLGHMQVLPTHPR